MKKITFISSLVFSFSVFAQNSSQCNFIQNQDQKNMCIAQAERRSSQCNFIQNQDQRNSCIAQVERRPSQCNFIQNQDQKNMCRAVSGG